MKTAQQHNSQIVGTLEVSQSREIVLTHDLLKIRLRLLVEGWKSHPHPGGFGDGIRQCAKELEEALK